MSKVKLSLSSLSAAEKIQFTRRVAEAMEQHSLYFPDPPFNQDGLNDAAWDLEGALNDAAALETQLGAAELAAEARESELDFELNAVGNYVQTVSNGDEKIIRLIGMEVAKPAAPIGPLPAPVGLSAEAGDEPGKIILRWKRIHGARSYQVEIQEAGGTGGWVLLGQCTQSKRIVSGLRSGARYAFRVSAIGAAGQGPWSAEVGG